MKCEKCGSEWTTNIGKTLSNCPFCGEPLAPQKAFPDKFLEAAVRKAAGVPDGTPLRAKDVEGITKLQYDSRPFWNVILRLDGIEHLRQLRELDLCANKISDLSPLSGLRQLTTLNLWCNQISDLSPLSGLRQLTELHLNNNQISDLSPLSGLSQLKELRLSFKDRKSVV